MRIYVIVVDADFSISSSDNHNTCSIILFAKSVRKPISTGVKCFLLYTYIPIYILHTVTQQTSIGLSVLDHILYCIPIVIHIGFETYLRYNIISSSWLVCRGYVTRRRQQRIWVSTAMRVGTYNELRWDYKRIIYDFLFARLLVFVRLIRF